MPTSDSPYPLRTAGAPVPAQSAATAAVSGSPAAATVRSVGGTPSCANVAVSRRRAAGAVVRIVAFSSRMTRCQASGTNFPEYITRGTPSAMTAAPVLYSPNAHAGSDVEKTTLSRVAPRTAFA
ncbi:hypothetical protein W59_31344 [Rhodococcus opacus RKJ300 = JCM 13270]|uniref:Uncharacterized protein n=1 Tax=Rhodococcus opacus RKJ300 = JCM 13270 TaxID=1165867 RepID=I0WD03_RHOOP|nr:hypothetical protein W59_31344 [Rhodococcus opacus RKJ300 = JCM 13270]